MAALNYGGKTPFSQGIKLAIILLSISILILIFLGTPTRADECSNIADLDKRAACYEDQKKEKEKEYTSIQSKLREIREKTSEISDKISQLASQISFTQEEINQLQNEINYLENEINIINDNLADRKETLSKKEELRNLAIRNLSKSHTLSFWEKLLTSSKVVAEWVGLEYTAADFVYDRAVSYENINWIRILNEEIISFEQDKEEALNIKADITRQQQNLINVRDGIAGEKTVAEEEKVRLEQEREEKSEKLLSLEEEIARLSAKQQAVLQLKDSGGVISGYEAPEYKLPDPPYRPAFALMSYGAFTHRYGMSQYGAKGRAEDGQSYKDILSYYYGEGPKEKDDFPKKIEVQGYGEMDFQKYLYGLAEMPHTWPKDALKAQAIAARAYAYREMELSPYYKRDGGICTTQSCQVFLKSKSDNPPKEWKEAVDETKNIIIGGSIKAEGYGMYSSSTGGYLYQSGWDTYGDWPNDAYEKAAGAWGFYRAWYNHPRNPASTDYCGRTTPWLNMEEMTDLLNAWVVWRKGTDEERDNIYPVSRACWSGSGYSMQEMAEVADKYDEKYTNISDVSKPTIANGVTLEICFNTNRGNKCINGQDFAFIVWIRAPGYIRIERDVIRKNFLYDIKMAK